MMWSTLQKDKTSKGKIKLNTPDLSKTIDKNDLDHMLEFDDDST